MLAQVARFHAQSLDEKLELKINEHSIGYLAIKAVTTRHPDVIANRRFRGANQLLSR